MNYKLPHFCFIIFLISSVSVFSQDFNYGDSIIKVGGDFNYPPFEYVNDGYIPKGFNVDIISAVAKTMQINIEINLKPWSVIRGDFDSGKIDMLQGMYYSKKRAEKYLFSAPILSMNQAVFKRKDSPLYGSINSLKGKEVIVQTGDIMHEYAVKNNLTDKIITVKSLEDGLRLLSSGKHDFLLSSRITGLYWIKKLDINNITTGENIVSFKYCFAVYKNNTELLNKLNEGLIIIQQTGVYNQIYEKWFSKLEPDLYIFSKVYKLVLIGVLILFSLLLVLGLWSRSLKKTVELRTDDLEKEIINHQKADIELEESRELYKTLFSEFTEAFTLYDIKDDKIINFNKKACELYGLDEHDLSASGFTGIAGPEKSTVLTDM